MPISDFSNISIEQATTAEFLAAQLMDYIPPSWTSGDAKVKPGTFWLLMNAIGLVLAAVKSAIAESKSQLRIETAFGDGLDNISLDFFGAADFRLPRLINETDDFYRNRIMAEILKERTTVQGIVNAVTIMTGAAPSLFEPFNASANAAWHGTFNGDVSPNMYGAFGYGGAPNDVNAGHQIDQFNAVNRADGSTPPSASPNPGVGASGDLNSPYTFFVNVIFNPNGVGHAALVALVNRMRAAGVNGIVFGGN